MFVNTPGLLAPFCSNPFARLVYQEVLGMNPIQKYCCIRMLKWGYVPRSLCEGSYTTIQCPRQTSFAPDTVTQDYQAKPVRLGLQSMIIGCDGTYQEVLVKESYRNIVV